MFRSSDGWKGKAKQQFLLARSITCRTEKNENRGTEKQGNRGTEEQRNRETEKQRNRETEKQRNRETKKQRNKETENIGTERQRKQRNR
jgi:hypothetical protein